MLHDSLSAARDYLLLDDNERNAGTNSDSFPKSRGWKVSAVSDEGLL